MGLFTCKFLCWYTYTFFLDSESETDEENEDNSNVFYSTYSSRMKVSQKQLVSESKEESYLTLNIHIANGLLCMCTPVRDATTNSVIPNQQGEFLINVEDATIFVVNGYMGNTDLGYTCLKFHNAQLYHCGKLVFVSQFGSSQCFLKILFRRQVIVHHSRISERRPANIYTPRFTAQRLEHWPTAKTEVAIGRW